MLIVPKTVVASQLAIATDRYAAAAAIAGQLSADSLYTAAAKKRVQRNEREEKKKRTCFFHDAAAAESQRSGHEWNQNDVVFI